MRTGDDGLRSSGLAAGTITHWRASRSWVLKLGSMEPRVSVKDVLGFHDWSERM